jgi:hypothetical protein
MSENFSLLIKSFGTRTDSAAETKSIGLAAYAQSVMFFATLRLKLFVIHEILILQTPWKCFS